MELNLPILHSYMLLKMGKCLAIQYLWWQVHFPYFRPSM